MPFAIRKSRTEDQPPAAPTGALPPLPALETLSEIHSALADVDLRRLEAQLILDGEQAADAALLEADAPDQQFSQLTMRVRSARRLLVRLDRREQEILSLAQQLDDDRRQILWTDYVEQYTAAAARLHVVAAACREAHAAVLALSNSAHRAGFGGIGAPALPAVYGHFNWHLLAAPNEMAPRLSRTAPPSSGMSLGPSSYVEFIKPFGLRLVGSAQAVPSERAKWLVEQGFAQILENSPFGFGPAPDANLGRKD